ncbi:MAG: hypothetical protein QXU18_00125 [Thermoplasmatales archaeon]
MKRCVDFAGLVKHIIMWNAIHNILIKEALNLHTVVNKITGDSVVMEQHRIMTRI